MCHKHQSKLTRHLQKVHKDSEQVAQILTLPRSDQRKEFAKMRNEGIVEQNKETATKGKEHKMERIKNSTSSETVHCAQCKGCYSKIYFYRHKKVCQGSTPILTQTLGIQNIDDEFRQILGSFQDKAGSIIRKDPTIQLIGKFLWQKEKTKVDKKDEVRKGVMQDMRNLATLYRYYQDETAGMSEETDGGAKDMFDIDNWQHLREAIVKMTVKDDSQVKYGLKNSLYYTLLKASEIMEGEALAQSGKGGKQLVEGQKDFQKLLKHHQNLLFGDAKYYINKSRQERLRLPTRTPPEQDMEALRTYTVDRISSLVNMEDIGCSEFVELRNLTCSRITLFNARRGGEPSRMTTDQWLEREKWINDKGMEGLSADEKKLFGEVDITYCTGKGNHLVSILIPKDSRKAMDILASKNIRSQAGIYTSNKFQFPSKASERHVGGWDTTNTILVKSGIDCPHINATNQRGRLSTLYAAQDVTPQEREAFYKHMGHSEAVNVGTYQRPLPVLAVTKVGRFLSQVDKGCAGMWIIKLLC